MAKINSRVINLLWNVQGEHGEQATILTVGLVWQGNLPLSHHVPPFGVHKEAWKGG